VQSRSFSTSQAHFVLSSSTGHLVQPLHGVQAQVYHGAVLVMDDGAGPGGVKFYTGYTVSAPYLYPLYANMRTRRRTRNYTSNHIH